MPPRISVTIIAGNEEERIAGAVRSAVWADEVLVLDSESTDRTAAVAREAGARVVVEPWRGYGAQKNRAAELARNDWVFSLDADERITPALRDAILALPEEPGPAAYRVRRRNRFAGEPLPRWPWSWDRTVRLYDRRRARFSERPVHESVVTSGGIGELPAPIEHYSYRGWEDLLERQVRYAILGARAAYEAGRRPRPGDLWLRPRVTFLRHWLGRGYLLGGLLGWRLAAAAAHGTWMRYVLLRELWERGADAQRRDSCGTNGMSAIDGTVARNVRPK